MSPRFFHGLADICRDELAVVMTNVLYVSVGRFRWLPASSRQWEYSLSRYIHNACRPHVIDLVSYRINMGLGVFCTELSITIRHGAYLEILSQQRKRSLAA